MICTDKTSECLAIFDAQYPGRGYKPLPLVGVYWLVWHKTGLSTPGTDNPNPVSDADLDAVTMVYRFAQSPDPWPRGLGTGGRVPYHILVRPDGATEQALPLTVQGAHARAYNGRSIAVALVGDCDKAPPCEAQYLACVELAARILPINGGLRSVGHTDLPGASWDATKRCPGSHLDPAQIASDAARLLPSDWRYWTAARAVQWARDGGVVVWGG